MAVQNGQIGGMSLCTPRHAVAAGIFGYIDVDFGIETFFELEKDGQRTLQVASWPAELRLHYTVRV